MNRIFLLPRMICCVLCLFLLCEGRAVHASDCYFSDSHSNDFSVGQMNCPPCCGTFSARIDVLYWQLLSEGFTYALSGIRLASATGTSYEQAESIKTDFEPGGRITLGYTSPFCSQWNARLSYLYFQTHASDSSSAPGTIAGATNQPPTAILVPIFMNRESFVNAQNAEADYDFDLHTLELLFGRDYLCYNCLTFTPYAGVKGAYMHQDFKVDYFGLIGNPTLGFTEARVHNNIDYWGAGVLAGVDASWCLGRCLSLVGNASLGILWSYSDFDLKETIPSGAERSSISNTSRSLNPDLHLFLGIRWDACFCQRFPINAYLGWEQEYYYNLILLNLWTGGNDSVYSTQTNNSLGLAGLTFGIAVSF